MNEQIVIQNDKIEELCQLIPRIGFRVNTIWGSKACRDYLVTLLSDSRNGARTGFDPAVAKLIYGLLADHDESYPQFDDSDQVVLPFGGYHRPIKSISAPTGGFGVVLGIAKWIVFAGLLAGIAKEVYKANLF